MATATVRIDQEVDIEIDNDTLASAVSNASIRDLTEILSNVDADMVVEAIGVENAWDAVESALGVTDIVERLDADEILSIISTNDILSYLRDDRNAQERQSIIECLGVSQKSIAQMANDLTPEQADALLNAPTIREALLRRLLK